jgi:hypothetical protein
MNAVAAPKSAAQNRLEGYALTAMLQGFPIFAAAALMLKLTHSPEIVGQRYGAAIFVALATPMFALLTPWLARRFPKKFSNGYEPLFFDASLSFAEKIAKWRIQPTASLQLLTTVLLLSLLAVGVASLG